MTRRDRFRLLLSSYLDACEAGRPSEDRTSHGKPGSRQLRRGHLWTQGSYWEVEKALDALKARNRFWYGWCWRVYVRGEKIRLEPHELSSADKGFDYALKKMPENIFVPMDISENAGFNAGAKSAARPRSRV